MTAPDETEGHPMLVIPRPSPEAELLREAKKAKVFAALFRNPTPRRFGRYKVVGVLGQGGMGLVVEAYDEQHGRPVALKVLHHDPAGRHEPRLWREAQALARLEHPNVVRVLEVGEVEGRLFVAMERLEGQTLRQWQDEACSPRGWRDCVEVYRQAGEGLAAAHAVGLVHRDFKPVNCIIDRHQRVRVVDFGLARAVDPAMGADGTTAAPTTISGPPDVLERTLTRTGQAMGTPTYMSLEQLQGQRANPQSDQFGFCVALYEAVHGERPFAGKTMMGLAGSIAAGNVRPVPTGLEVPELLRQLLRRGLAAKPQDRWPSMLALLARLRTLVATDGRG